MSRQDGSVTGRICRTCKTRDVGPEAFSAREFLSIKEQNSSEGLNSIGLACGGMKDGEGKRSGVSLLTFFDLRLGIE